MQLYTDVDVGVGISKLVCMGRAAADKLAIGWPRTASGDHVPIDQMPETAMELIGPVIISGRPWTVLVTPSIFRDTRKDDGAIPNFKLSETRWRRNFFCTMVKPEGSLDVSSHVPVSHLKSNLTVCQRLRHPEPPSS